jgi:hypothetical protein
MQLSQDRASINEIAAFLTFFGVDAISDKFFDRSNRSTYRRLPKLGHGQQPRTLAEE